MEIINDDILYLLFNHLDLINSKFFRETNKRIADIGLSYFYRNYYFYYKRSNDEYKPYIRNLKTNNDNTVKYQALTNLVLGCKKMTALTRKNNIPEFKIDNYISRLNCLTELYLANCNTYFEPGVLPVSLKKFYIDSYVRQLEPDVLPINLERLQICYYNHKLKKNVLPNSLKEFIIINGFNHQLKPRVLPESLVYFFMGVIFNRPLLPGCFPKSLHVLKFGSNFDQIIGPNVLPISLKSLTFYNYNQIINKDILPKSLMSLVLKQRFNQNTNNFIPDSLTIFSLDTKAEYITENYLSNKLTSLTIQYNNLKRFTQNLLPSSLTYLDLFCEYNYPLERNILPLSLKTLIFRKGYKYDFFPGILPDNLELLIFGDDYTGVLYPNSLPISLQTIRFKGKCPNLLNNILPTSLKLVQLSDDNDVLQSLNSLSHLSLENLIYKFSKRYEELPISYFPHNLTSIHIWYRYEKYPPKPDKTIAKILQPGVLPPTLKKLHLCGEIQSLEAGILPDSLLELDVTTNRIFPSSRDVLPKSLARLIVNGKYYNLSKKR